ncbi:hypothetical protein OC846_005493, partial [Tilletia horrida]
RVQVKNACINCQRACKKCDIGRPCTRCVKYGLEDSCADSSRKERKRGIKRGPYKRRTNTAGSSSSTNSLPTPPMQHLHQFGYGPSSNGTATTAHSGSSSAATTPAGHTTPSFSQPSASSSFYPYHQRANTQPTETSSGSSLGPHSGFSTRYLAPPGNGNGNGGAMRWDYPSYGSSNSGSGGAHSSSLTSLHTNSASSLSISTPSSGTATTTTNTNTTGSSSAGSGSGSGSSLLQTPPLYAYTNPAHLASFAQHANSSAMQSSGLAAAGTAASSSSSSSTSASSHHHHHHHPHAHAPHQQQQQQHQQHHHQQGGSAQQSSAASSNGGAQFQLRMPSFTQRIPMH